MWNGEEQWKNEDGILVERRLNTYGAVNINASRTSNNRSVYRERARESERERERERERDSEIERERESKRARERERESERARERAREREGGCIKDPH